ncbi:MAG: ribose 5-phosphate isomerase B [Candidatus Saganbacteria bacterium]|nr:ribose 5-phosphate isomerase B [Candidatus Saganbacteria bacterium]
MKIAIGSDHGGFELKEAIKKQLQKQKISFKDFGCATPDSMDYTDIAYPLAKAVAAKKFTCGILVCGTGIGMSMAANKTPKIRAALCHNVYTAEMSRKHNNANLLCLGGRVLKTKDALAIVKTFLSTPFEGGRHLRRIKKMMQGGK